MGEGGMPEAIRQKAREAARAQMRKMPDDGVGGYSERVFVGLVDAAADTAYAEGLAAGRADERARVASLNNPQGPYATPRPGTFLYSFSPWPHQAADPALAHLCALIPVRLDGYFTPTEFDAFHAALECNGMTLREVERRRQGHEDEPECEVIR